MIRCLIAAVQHLAGRHVDRLRTPGATVGLMPQYD